MAKTYNKRLFYKNSNCQHTFKRYEDNQFLTSVECNTCGKKRYTVSDCKSVILYWLFLGKEFRSHQENLEHYWFWKVEVPSYWYSTKIYNMMNRIKLLFVRIKEDDLPF